MKMDKTMIILSAVVGSLGVLSAILGFSAEGSKLTLNDIRFYGDECYYPPNPAPALAICAGVFLLVAQIMVTAMGGCCGCCKPGSRAAAVPPSETKRIVGIVCAILSWVAAGVAWVLLLVEAQWNANGFRRAVSFGVCYYPKDGIFAGAAVLSLAATGLGVTSYIMFRGHHQRTKIEAASTGAAAAPDNKPQPQGPGAGIAATGHPQLPPPPIPAGPPSQPQPPPSPQDNHGAQTQSPAPSAPPEVPEQPPSPPIADYSVQPPVAPAVPDLAPQGSEQPSSSNLIPGISNQDLLNAGIKVLVEVVKDSVLSSDSIDPTGAMAAGGAVLSIVTGNFDNQLC